MISKYTLVSALSLIVDYSIYISLIKLFDASTPLAASIGYIVGIFVHYVISRRYVFKAGPLSHRPAGEFLAYVVTGLVGLAVTAGTVLTLAAIGITNIYGTKSVAVVASFFGVYYLRRNVLFRAAVG